MEDNFINLGNIKGETSQRYMISSDKQYFPFKAVDRFGKFIRLPSRLMTATDALVQAPNILAAAKINILLFIEFNLVTLSLEELII